MQTEQTERRSLLNEREEIRRLLSYLTPYTPQLVIGIFLMLVMGVLEGIVALAIKPAVDVVLNPLTPIQNLPLFTIPYKNYTLDLRAFVPASIHNVVNVFAISLLAIFVMKGVAEYAGSLLIQHGGLSSITDLRNQVYSKVVQQPVAFFQENAVGRVMTAVITDIEQMRPAFSDWFAELFRQSFSLVAFVLALLVIDWRMAIGCAALVPLVVLPAGKFGRKIRKSSQKSRTHVAGLSQIVQETVSGNRVVKAFGMERFEIQKFREEAKRLLRENMRWIRAFAATSPVMDFLGAIVIALAIYVGRGEIKASRMTEGSFIAFAFLLFRAAEPLKRLGTVYQLFLQAVGVSTQAFAYIDMPEEVVEAPGSKTLPPFKESIQFDDATFGYDSSGLILRGVDLNVRAGTVVAIVGSSGAGKTTLVNLLPRFLDATSGAVRIDGHNLKELTLRSIREQMAIVTQETILFNDTIWNNLCYGRPKMPEAKVYAAARTAMAHDFITKMPEGYQTMVGDRGQRLSGGQRQRLAIARALLKDAPILILDEATSELDTESEIQVQDALNNLMTGRTVFVIAHRLTTIRRADVIVVLDGGVVAEIGTHDNLLARGGIYARLYELQFRDMDPPREGVG